MRYGVLGDTQYAQEDDCCISKQSIDQDIINIGDLKYVFQNQKHIETIVCYLKFDYKITPAIEIENGLGNLKNIYQ